MKRSLLLSIVLVGYVMGAHAEDQTTAAEQTDNVMKLNPAEGQTVPVKDIDEEITNARMRATLGSKSKWSFKSALGYSGGSIDRPTASVRPNYRASATVESLPSITGTIGINYRLNAADSFSFGTGVSIVDPLHGGITKPATDDRKGRNGKVVSRYVVATPSISWSRGYKALGSQMISGLSYSHYTDEDSAEASQVGYVGFTQTVLANLGQSRWSGGVSASVNYDFTSGDPKESVRASYESGAFKRGDLLLALYPFAEYSFTDRYSFRTVFGYFEMSHYKDEYGNAQKFSQNEPYQSVGIGISVTRDIYLYPNVQFTPKDIRSDRTNVALSTNINI